MKNYIYALVLFCFGIQAFGQTFTDTKGELQISNSGQATYTIPIAMPPSIKDVAPVINLVYSSGVRGGIMGQGWNISSISSITRIATRRDIDGFVDGVDFDDNDKLALDGQRLLIKTGTYWENNSTYETEYKSNTKIELKIEPTAYGPKTYFIITEPDGSRTYYGSTGNGVIQNAVSANAWYIIRHEDVYLNYITYVYQDYTYNSTTQKYITEIKFSGNETQGIPQANKIVFQYVDAKRVDRDFINGNAVYATKILDKVFVYTNEAIFRSYEMTRIDPDNMGYERVSQVVEKNGLGEAANPIVFEYETTLPTTNRTVKDYYTNFSFNDINFAGDFDGDGRLDFVADNKLYTNLFINNAGNSPITLPFTSIISTVEPKKTFVATTIQNGKLNQFQSIVNTVPTSNGLTFKVYNLNNNSIVQSYSKTVNLGAPTQYIGYNHNMDTLIEGDYNGDGVSEVIIVSSPSQSIIAPDDPCHMYGTCGLSDLSDRVNMLDLNINSSVNENTQGLVRIGISGQDLRFSKNYVADFNGDGKSDILLINLTTKVYFIYSFTHYKSFPWITTEIIGQGILNDFSTTKQILFGDFNGDGKTDIMLPTTEGYINSNVWAIYYSNPQSNVNVGNFFNRETLSTVEYWQDTTTYYNTQRHRSAYYAMDINNDGKSDLVRVWVKYAKRPSIWWDTATWNINNHDTYWSVRAYTNTIGVTGASPFTQTYDSGEFFSDSPDIPISVASSFKYDNINTDLVIVRNHYDKIEYYSFNKDIERDNRLKTVSEGNGSILQSIEYKPMVSLGTNTDFYSSGNVAFYPNIDFIKNSDSFLVSKLSATINNVSKYQDFRYHSLISNFNYGSIGFAKTARSSWYLQPSDIKIWTVEQHDISLRGATTKTFTTTNETTLFNATPINLLSTKTNVFSNYINPDSKVYNVLLDSQTSDDALTKVRIQTNYTYDGTVSSTNYYGLQTQSVTNYYNDNVLQGTNTTTTAIEDYDNNPTGLGNLYYIGRPKKVSTNKKLISPTGTTTDERTSEESYRYTGANITHTEKKGHLTADALVEDMTYDGVGNLLTKTVSMPTCLPAVAPRTITDEYEPSKRLVSKKINHQGYVTLFEYNPLGQVKKSTDYMGVVSEYAYDNWGKITQSKTTNASETPTITTTGYVKLSDGGYTITSTNTTGNTAMSATEYDVVGREVKKTTKGFASGSFIYQTTEYDALGRKWKVSEPFETGTPKKTIYEYDDFHRPTKVTASTGRIQELNYFHLTTISDEDNGKVTTATLDALGNKIQTTDPGGLISFTYYANGQLKESDYEGHKVTIGIDGWGNKISTFDPNAGLYTYEYDGFGQIKKETTPKGHTDYVYDDYGKLTYKKILGDGTDFNTTYTYNTFGQLTKEISYTSGNVLLDSYDYGYDTLHRLNLTTENTTALEHTKTIAFDTYGRIETETNYTREKVSGTNFASTITTQLHYNVYNGVMYKISNPATNNTLWELNTANAKMQALTATLGNGIVITNSYDSDSYFTAQQHKKGSVFVLNNTYNFNAIKGTLLERQNLAIGLSKEYFTYDNLDHLETWTNPLSNTIDRNVYDTKGRITTNNKLGTINYNPDLATGIYKKTSIKLTPEGLAYYNGSNLGGNQTVSYTMFKSPISINESGKGKMDFEYNSHLSRTKMVYDNGLLVSGTTKVQRKSKYLTDDGSTEVLFDIVTHTIKIRTFVGGDAYSAVLYQEKQLDQNTNVTTTSNYYLHRDYLGSILAISNEQGVAVEKRAFDAWGNLSKLVDAAGTSQDVTGGLRFFDRGYTSHEHLQEVGLIHMNGRLYDPVLRSFLMPDNFIQQPENTQNYNRYAYCLNNPLLYTDPSGEAIQIAAAIIISVFISAAAYTLSTVFADIPFSLGGFTKSVFIGAASGAFTFGIGSASLNLCANIYAKAVFSAIAHGMVQGTMSGIQGGSFWSGFAAGALSSIAASSWSIDGNGAQEGLGWAGNIRSSEPGMVTFGTVIGGASAKLTGGNFWVGAVTGLTVSLLNHVAHEIDPPGKKSKTNIKVKKPTFKESLVATEGTVLSGFETVQKSEIGNFLRNGKPADAGVSKFLGSAGKLFGIKSIYDHGSAAYDSYQKHDYYSMSMNLTKTGVDIIMLGVKTSPLIFVLSTAYNIYDTSGYLDSNLGIKN